MTLCWPCLQHFDCERSKETDTRCVSVLWVVGTPRVHHVIEFGAVASRENAVLERPGEGGQNGRIAIAAFELWREGGSLKRSISEGPE